MTKDEVMALSDKELNIRAAELRGFKRLSISGICDYLDISRQSAEAISSEIWMWQGDPALAPEENEAAIIRWEGNLDYGWIVYGHCPDYVRSMDWWYLAKKIPSATRQKCVANWREAPRRVVRAFILEMEGKS